MREAAFLPLSGELGEARLEAEFRTWSRADHAVRTRTALRVAAGLMVVFALADVGYHGFGLQGLGLAGARIGWGSVALLAASRVESRSVELLDRTTALLSVGAVAIVIASASQRPSGFQPHTLTVAAVVVATYLLMPLRFSSAVGVGVGTSLAYLAMSIRNVSASGPLIAITAGFAVANAIGLTGHAWVARLGRSEFLRVRAAEEAHAERLAFLASTSHELRSPLHGIVACAELLAGTTLDEEQQGLVGLIRSSGAAMAGLLEEAVHQVRGGHELPAIDPIRLDLHAFHDEVTAFVRARAATHGVVVSAERSASVPRWVHGDGGRLRQVLLNFAENALAHGAKSRIVLAIATKPRLPSGRIPVSFAVRDDGPGVPREQREAILRPFVQVHSSSRGMGLGLSICDRIARAMDARIEIDDAPEGGATFQVTVPLLEATGPAEPIATLEGPRREVLLVEDEAVSRRLMTLLLERMGHGVTVAASGETALERLSERAFDVVLMDLRLPRMDGVETLRRVRERDPSVPVFALSAHAAHADHGALLSAGFQAILPKPLDLARLRSALAELAAPADFSEVAADTWLDESKLALHVEAIGRAEVVRLVQMFVETTGPVVDAIGLAAEGGRFADVAALAHRLAGASDSVALVKCSSEAARVEMLAREGGPVPPPTVHALRETYEDSRRRASSWARGSSPSRDQS